MAITTLASGTAANAGERKSATPAAPAGSQDRAWTTTGDADGFHVMVADAKDQYGWRTAASLSEPGFDTDTWIGNACVTGSGQRAVVVYAPRTFTNKPQLMARGGFTAIVDLASGQVTKLDLQASLSYYNPGCGVDEGAILTQSPGEDKTSTRLVRVDAATGALSPAVETKGQVTSAVPAKDGSIVAADGGALVKIEANGASTRLAATRGVPFRLTADRDGGVVYLDKLTAPQAKSAAAERLTATQIRKPEPKKTKPTELAAGPLAETGLARDAAGTVYVTGPVKQTADKLPDVVRLLPTAPKDAKVGTRGESVLTRTAWADGKDTRIDPDEAVAVRPVSIDLTVRATGRTASAVVDPAAKPGPNIVQGKDRSPKLPAPKDQPQAALAGGGQSLTDPRPPGSSTQIVEAERTCAVPRNDPSNQAMQPKPRQVEWAVDQAIVGNLDNKVSRPANWKNLGMPAYQPQAMFPLQALSGGGSRVPAQVMLGVTAQESNMWQASRTTVPGVTGNPLIGNYYGINYYDGNPANDWDIDWSKADCGYGITQVTDHMRLAGREDGKLPAWDYQQQRAVALDYTANIAAGLQILTEKWNVTHDNGLIVNNGNSAKIENWYFALWAYNSGFYPNPGDGGPWGVGWANNPANPEWDAGRLPFLEKGDGSDNYPDAAHPQDWPYQEKVIGWAGHPLEGLESPGKMVAGYRQAWWNGRDGDATTVGTAKYYRAQAKPPEGLFCAPENACDATKITDAASNDPGVGPCTRADHKCWWNKPATYKLDCDYSCGNDLVRFNTTYPEEPDGTAYPPACTLNGLPAGALVVDDVPDNVPSIRPDCGHSWTNAGTFTMTFGNDPNAGTFPAKVDTHQLGAGFGGHFYFAHTRRDDPKGQLLKVLGEWAFNQAVTGPAKVFVHLPDHGAQTKQATYEIENGWGKPVRRTISQAGATNRWVELGVFRFAGVPKIRLNSITADGTGDQDVAFDAVAVAPGNYAVGGLDITVPEPDPTAPDPVDNQPRLVNGFSAASQTAKLGSDPAAPKCGPIDPATGAQWCTSIGQVGSTPSRAATPPIASVINGPVDWCNNGNLIGDWMNRDAACLGSMSPLNAELKKDGTTIGTAQFIYKHEIELDIAGINFQEWVYLKPVKIDPALQSINVAMTFTCTAPPPAAPACDTHVTTTGATSWMPTDLHEVRMLVDHSWTGTSSKNELNLGWFAMVTAPFIPTASTGWWEWQDPKFQVRCDRIVPGKFPGCVFPAYGYAYPVNTKKYPVAAAYYWIMQQRMISPKNPHPGQLPDNLLDDHPLHRHDDRASNYNVICDNTFAAHQQVSNYPEPAQCDEFPIASSKESGAMKGATSGNQCAQIVAWPMGGKKWNVTMDENYPAADWQNLVCGRATMTKSQNEGAFNWLGVRFKDFRILDGDPFYIKIPGFQNCNPDIACVVTLP
ncbi:golvesin C-terminal-like domain-containing protein [Embleya hyalina]|uniref:Type IV secretion protein Rhs n=1 Tax=Embleya hyalina TaxID=516124 RepID=A0A401YYK9_9ACTN|nr:hypothetical protein [Embleya hyalina]GCD99630.1 type IV secretion protein Rhs [Embleya hyalina]